MKKAYISINYLFIIEPNEVGLDNNCSEEELYAAAEDNISKIISEMDESVLMEHNDLEICIMEDV